MTNLRKRYICDLKTRRAACRILGVSEVEGKEAIQKAYRRASLKYHPDHNPDDKDAHKRFLLVKCAYELLAKDKPCDMLLDEIESWPGVPEDDRYELDNLWGHFLWWREKFF
jgi:preprotein translocase subunit Sec63